MFKNLLCMLMLAGAASTASATTVTYAGTQTQTGNCIPFGCGAMYGPHEGFVYKNIAAFTLNVGDIIAFDTSVSDGKAFSFDLSLAATTYNGGATANSAGFTKVSSLAPAKSGSNVVGDYDVAFVVNQAFTFAGGGLIIDFLATTPASDAASLVFASDNPYAVNRYYYAQTAGVGSTDTYAVGNFRIITNTAAIPEPASLALLGLGLLGFAAVRRSHGKGQRG